MKSLNNKGCSTCENGQENFLYFYAIGSKNERFVQYDYRTPEGELFSCVKSTLKECRESRDEWLKTINKGK